MPGTYDDLWRIVLGALIGWLAFWLIDKFFRRDGEPADVDTVRALEGVDTLEAELKETVDERDALRNEAEAQRAESQRLAGLLGEALSAAGVAHRVARAGNFLSVFFTEEPVSDFAAARASETFRFAPFFHALLDAGVYAPPSAFETWFVSSALDDDAFETIAAALPGAARAAAEARSS